MLRFWGLFIWIVKITWNQWIVFYINFDLQNIISECKSWRNFIWNPWSNLMRKYGLSIPCDYWKNRRGIREIFRIYCLYNLAGFLGIIPWSFFFISRMNLSEFYIRESPRDPRLKSFHWKQKLMIYTDPEITCAHDWYHFYITNFHKNVTRIDVWIVPVFHKPRCKK